MSSAINNNNPVSSISILPIAPQPDSLEKVRVAYANLKKAIEDKDGSCAEIAQYLCEIYESMEGFIIYKAKKEAEALGRNLWEVNPSEEQAWVLPKGTLSTLNIRYPELRAPAFQTCIEQAHFYSEAYNDDNQKLDDTTLLREMGKVIEVFNQYSREIYP